MSLIKCLVCGCILAVSRDGDKDVCSCHNETTLYYDTDVIQISGHDLSKISVFRESSASFQDTCL